MSRIAKIILHFDCRFPDWPFVLVAGLTIAVLVRSLVEIIAR